jgi:hypothetical protein
MSFLSSVSDYFGGSAKHASKASAHLSEAASSASEGGSSVINGASNFLSSTTLVAGAVAWNSFEFVSGKIIAANSAAHFAQGVASLAGGNTAINLAVKATSVAAMTLVQFPVGSMALLMAGSIIATHPKESFEAVKKFGKAAYKFTEAGVYTTAAVAEAAAALGLKAVELADDAIETFTDASAIFVKEIEMTGFSSTPVSQIAEDAMILLLGNVEFSADF